MTKKEALKKFFEPNWDKIVTLISLEFLLTFTTLFFAESTPFWIYFLSPNALYLESMADLIFSSTMQLALHGAIANVIAISYIYFLSCLIDAIYRRVRK